MFDKFCDEVLLPGALICYGAVGGLWVIVQIIGWICNHF
ncbi:hypothetical protein Asfd1_54 [Aeromonas phage Asfd_1]|nr:hypothetical protein Asfd1_54 [Aeromonas phage Asfd_1]